MNQQRARRFRAAQESTEKHVLRTERVRVLTEAGKSMAERDKKHSFDSNCITPGTEFMARLSDSLRVYITNRISTNEAWRSIIVIFSDANVPGEGEHKIMEYIRAQRAQAAPSPPRRHVLYGADADLIMLGLVLTPN